MTTTSRTRSRESSSSTAPLKRKSNKRAVVHLQHDIPYTCVTYGEQVLGIKETDTTFSTTGLFHAYGFGNNLTLPYWVGASTVLHAGRHTPATVLDTIEKRKPTLFFSA